MAVLDLTNKALTVSGNHLFLYYALEKAKEDHVALYEEMATFDPKEKYPKLDPKVARFFTFARRIFRSEINIILVTASLIEAMANLFYAENAPPEVFAVLERATPIEKWVELPKLYLPSYTFPKDGKLYNTLITLNKRRNSITHPKPHMVVGDRLLHKGNLYKPTSDEYKLHLEFCKLPLRLVANLKKHDQGAGTNLEMMFFLLPDVKDPVLK